MKPILPPRKGFTEVVVNGQHLYRNAKTGQILRTPISEPAASDTDNSTAVWDELAEAYREGVNAVDE